MSRVLTPADDQFCLEGLRYRRASTGEPSASPGVCEPPGDRQSPVTRRFETAKLQVRPPSVQGFPTHRRVSLRLIAAKTRIVSYSLCFFLCFRHACVPHSWWQPRPSLHLDALPVYVSSVSLTLSSSFALRISRSTSSSCSPGLTRNIPDGRPGGPEALPPRHLTSCFSARSVTTGQMVQPVHPSLRCFRVT